MSGIAGILSFVPRPDRERLVRAMIARLSHRGPDAEGFHADDRFVAGHCALRTTPESHREQQPRSSERGDLLLVADARIDHRDDLVRDLAARGIVPRLDTDAELILCAFQAWGDDAPAHLLGDYAYAVWDAGRGVLHCARDPFAARPFYYRADAETFRFASEPQALFADPEVRAEPDRLALASTILLNAADAERTPFEGILKLRPAHVLVVSVRGEVRLRRAWEMQPGTSPMPRTDGERVERFTELFRDAVRWRLRSTGPVGIWLSGGIDSSGVAAMSAEVSRSQGKTGTPRAYSMTFPGLKCDERGLIEITAAHCGMPLTAVPYPVGSASPPEPEGPLLPEPPTYVPYLIIPAVLRRAGEDGVRVMLDGHGGDSLFETWYHFLADLARAGRILSVLRSCRDEAKLRALSPLRLFLRQAAFPLLPESIQRLAFRLSGRGLFVPAPAWIREPYRSALADTRMEAPFDRSRYRTRSEQHANENLWSGSLLRLYLPSWEQACAAGSVESRHPCLDRRLVEFAFDLPLRLRRDGALTKVAARRMLADRLPPSIWKDRRDNVFSDLCEYYMQQIGEDRFRRTLGRSFLVASRVVDGDRVLQAFRSARNDGGVSSMNIVLLQRFLMVEDWSRAAFASAALRP